jgi:hypothetical protein
LGCFHKRASGIFPGISFFKTSANLPADRLALKWNGKTNNISEKRPLGEEDHVTEQRIKNRNHYKLQDSRERYGIGGSASSVADSAIERFERTFQISRQRPSLPQGTAENGKPKAQTA